VCCIYISAFHARRESEARTMHKQARTAVVLMAAVLVLLPLWVIDLGADAARLDSRSSSSGISAMAKSDRSEFQEGVAGYSGCTDTYISAWTVDTNYCSATELQVKGDGPQRTLIRFDLSLLHAVPEIDVAYLELHIRAGNPKLGSVRAYRVRRDWRCDSATWRLAQTGVEWAAAGCSNSELDRYFSFEGTGYPSPDRPGYYRVELRRETLEAWITDPGANKGLLLIGGGGYDYYGFSSVEVGDEKRRPMLTIEWMTPLNTLTPSLIPSATLPGSPTPSPSPSPSGLPTVTPTPTTTLTPTITPTATPVTPTPTRGPGEPAFITLTVNPGVMVGCGGTAIAEAMVTDRYGTPVRDGTVVVFDITPQGAVEPINGGITQNGLARAIVASGTIPGPATVWAWPLQFRTSVVATFGVVFRVGPPARLHLVAEPPAVVVGGNQATIRLQVLDCADNPVTDGTTVTFTLAYGEGSLSPASAKTAGGWAYTNLTSPNQTGSATIRAAAGEHEASVDVEYTAGRPFDIVLTADPYSIPADGASTARIYADIKDRFGNRVADGTTVTFSTDSGLLGMGGSHTTSTLAGVAQVLLTSSPQPGIAQVAAISGGRRGSVAIDFYYVPPSTPTPTRTPRPRLYLPIALRSQTR
jgi:hypothetical protein